jgi:hypothetical protein
MKSIKENLPYALAVVGGSISCGLCLYSLRFGTLALGMELLVLGVGLSGGMLAGYLLARVLLVLWERL